MSTNARLLKIDSPAAQVISGVTYVVMLFVLLYVIEMIYFASNSSATRFKTLVGFTAASTDSMIVIRQNLAAFPDANPIGLSVNERTGIEFGYSFYLYVNSSTITGSNTFKHVFHKGYTNPWPLMAPGVFIHGETNTMRVVMNTYKNPFTYADVKNIPMQKWFHVVLNNYKGGLDIFINGNLANRITFKDTLPYQNFQDIILFSNANINSLRGSGIPALNNEDFQLEGSFKGYLSNMKYARYALSINEVQNLMAAGPSSTMKQKNMDIPPYLGDDWWSHSA